MRTRMYGGVRGRKTKVGGKPTFVFLLLDIRYGLGPCRPCCADLFETLQECAAPCV